MSNEWWTFIVDHYSLLTGHSLLITHYWS